jgi:hypothetical protein
MTTGRLLIGVVAAALLFGACGGPVASPSPATPSAPSPTATPKPTATPVVTPAPTPVAPPTEPPTPLASPKLKSGWTWAGEEAGMGDGGVTTITAKRPKGAKKIGVAAACDNGTGTIVATTDPTTDPAQWTPVVTCGEARATGAVTLVAGKTYAVTFQVVNASAGVRYRIAVATIP